ncbi:MAG: response regulator [Myxococcales bacterium]|nr:response regulator [Myxococcales bacterium]
METRSRVLLVEDNPALAENVTEILEELDVDVRWASDGRGAIERAKEGFTVALVDVGLPGESGVDLMPRLRALSSDAEIILVTGHGTLESAIAAVRHGAFAYLLKPVDPEALLGAVERALSQVTLRRERTSLSRALGESEALYRGVVENVDALIVSVDPEGRVTFANAYALGVIGETLDEARGRPFAQVFGDPSDTEQTEAVDRVICAGIFRERQCVLRPAKGEKRVVRWTFTSVGDGQDRARVAIGIDVTETLELRRRTAESEALVAVGTLTAGLAHEIRNPLNAAALQLQVLQRRAAKVADEALREKILEPVQLVSVELGRLTTMLNDFLGLARPQAIERERFSIHGLASEVLRVEGPVCETHELHLDVEGDPELAVIGDRDRLRQVLVNLIVNAREAMLGSDTPGERITIAFAPDDADEGRVEVCVQDSGPGLPDDLDPFEPFITTKAAGTGLGLSIVRKIVRMHGSEIVLQNAPGGGALARFSLPRG